MRRGSVALTSGTSLLLLTGFGLAVWGIIAPIRQATHGGLTQFYGLDQAAHDAIQPVLGWTILSLPLLWIVGTMILLAIDQRREISLPLLVVIFGQFLCLVVWILPAVFLYGLSMGAWVMWSATRHPLTGRVYRAAIGAVLTFSGVLYAMELMLGVFLWLTLACYAVVLAIYWVVVLVRPAMLRQDM